MTAPSTRNVSEREARQVAEAAREQDWRKPSFAKELFLGRFRLDLIHPHPTPATEDAQRGEEFLAKLRDFCETKIDGARIEREAQIPDETIDGLKEIGALGMKIDTKYGGLGLTQVYYNKALALVGSANPAIGALLSAHQSIGVPQPLKLFGTQEQKDTFLPRCARTDISAFLLTEPDVGSDPARLATMAVPDGEDYVLDGVKLWTTNGVVADLLVVMARVPKSEGHKGGITAFVVEAAAEGVTVENRNAFMGLRGIENGVTRFHRVRVPAANRIGPEGAGLKIALTTLNTGRLSLPAMCVGAGKWCLKIAREWSAAREQWGKPIAEHEAVGSKISFIAATTFALEAVVDLSSQMADEDRNDIRIEAALAKLYGSEMGWLMADELVQIRGGRGFETAASSRPAASAPCPPSRSCAICASTGSSRAPRRSCTCSSPARRWTRTCPWPVTSSTPRSRSATRAGPPPRPVRSTPAGCPSWSPGPVNYRVRTRSSGNSPGTCGTWSGQRASWPGPPSTPCPAGRAGWRPNRASSAGSWTSAPNCSP